MWDAKGDRLYITNLFPVPLSPCSPQPTTNSTRPLHQLIHRLPLEPISSFFFSVPLPALYIVVLQHSSDDAGHHQLALPDPDTDGAGRKAGRTDSGSNNYRDVGEADINYSTATSHHPGPLPRHAELVW